jgi:hypothetical protein
MSSLGGPYGSPAPYPPPQPGRGSDIPTWMVVTALVVTVSMTATLLFAMFHRGDEAPTTVSPPGKTFPTHWNKRVAPLARIAARERGLEFAHPVAVRFLSPKAFSKTVTRDDGDLTRGDRRDIENTTGLLRALGLVNGKVDLFKQENDLNSGGILAYYSYQDQRITVRGHALTPAVKSTLVHELTHVLQDQHFQIGDRMKQLRHAGKDTAGSVLDAVIEGDAVRVQNLYRSSLSPRQQARLDASQKKANGAGQHRISRVPPALVTMMASPYTLGQGLVETVAAHGGRRAVDGLFRHPPTHETALLDPSRVISHQTGARHVDLPALRKGQQRFDSGELGVLTWYFMLGERIPLTEALAAADGWGGDAYTAYDAHGTSCMRASFVGRTRAATDRMYTDLRRWIADGSAATASVRRHGTRLGFRSCDPGSAGATHTETTKAAMALVATRAALAAGLTKRGLPATAARCLAGRMVDTWSVSELNSPTFGSDDPTTQTRLQELAVTCH